MAEPLIAIVNTSDEFAGLLQELLRDEGFTLVVIKLLQDFKSGREDFSEFLTRHEPRLVVVDIAIPYRENWDFARSLCTLDAARGRELLFTTTNKKGLESFVGESDAVEIIGKPFDLDLFLKSVCRALGVDAPKGPCLASHVSRAYEPQCSSSAWSSRSRSSGFLSSAVAPSGVSGR